jgi:pimeloyl-ACP methyl ester carboxylesterase
MPMAGKRLRTWLLAAAALAAAAPGSADGRPAACVDDTPHEVRMVRVAPGVTLEVIDWGGTGAPMVLLTGLGDNAHVFDNFAQQFTGHFRVYGITRRGFLPSSQPRTGYDVARRAADDVAVLDALKIDRAIFVGHSLAGSELSALGRYHAGRVDKLVYLDAADLAERFKPSRAEPPGAAPLFTPATLESLQTYQAASARYLAVREPDPSVCHNLVFDGSGRITDSTSPDWVTEKLLAGVSAIPPTDWSNIAAPRLGIYAPYTHEARQAWYFYLDPKAQAEFDRAWPPIMSWFRQTVNKFAAGNEPNTYWLWGAPHYVYISNEAEVVRWMRDFLGVPRDG